ncbi:hypothetical protein AX774_g394 [Zancudomyces culisetae]|uniref:Uncharacterized protein n=1 Tax=Zancudomyces culisetae TaxID=1213189 RepID=A0A1R1PYM3_ZANCU|nr:hypothetical protein AX774_g5355 [Zancudomyces culisetae]OMH86045.1 hypothetical protein AX774_g394 [Zancudomyces culisetae]|eukprot:OMH81200.1 hypothetical protein AX774_g5355 [Zancudomyces culisetae]
MSSSSTGPPLTSPVCFRDFACFFFFSKLDNIINSIDDFFERLLDALPASSFCRGSTYSSMSRSLNALNTSLAVIIL